MTTIRSKPQLRGHRYSTSAQLSERDLYDLADMLAIQLHQRLGPRVYLLSRGDVADLVDPYIDDLCTEDRQLLPWMIWHLFQDARDLELEAS